MGFQVFNFPCYFFFKQSNWQKKKMSGVGGHWGGPLKTPKFRLRFWVTVTEVRSGLVETSQCTGELGLQMAGVEDSRPRSPIPTDGGRSPRHPLAKFFRMWRQKAAISNCLQSSLKNIKHVQLALVQKRKNNKRHSGPCGHPPTPASWATSASAPTTPGSQIVPLGVHGERSRESSNQRLTGEGGGRGPFRGEGESHGCGLSAQTVLQRAASGPEASSRVVKPG